jgi:hypothetical protein
MLLWIMQFDVNLQCERRGLLVSPCQWLVCNLIPSHSPRHNPQLSAYCAP